MSEEIIFEFSNRTFFFSIFFFVFSLKLAVFVEKSENVCGGTLDKRDFYTWWFLIFSRSMVILHFKRFAAFCLFCAQYVCLVYGWTWVGVSVCACVWVSCVCDMGVCVWVCMSSLCVTLGVTLRLCVCLHVCVCVVVCLSACLVCVLVWVWTEWNGGWQLKDRGMARREAI